MSPLMAFQKHLKFEAFDKTQAVFKPNISLQLF